MLVHKPYASREVNSETSDESGILWEAPQCRVKVTDEASNATTRDKVKVDVQLVLDSVHSWIENMEDEQIIIPITITLTVAAKAVIHNHHRKGPLPPNAESTTKHWRQKEQEQMQTVRFLLKFPRRHCIYILPEVRKLGRNCDRERRRSKGYSNLIEANPLFSHICAYSVTTFVR